MIAVTDPDTTIDVYMGSGGAPEGVLAAAALRCVGGQFQGRLLFRNDDEKRRAAQWGVEDLDRIYHLEDLAKGDVIFAATGVTDGSLLEGVKRRKDKVTTESVVMRASTGTVRWVRGEHRRAPGSIERSSPTVTPAKAGVHPMSAKRAGCMDSSLRWNDVGNSDADVHRLRLRRRPLDPRPALALARAARAIPASRRTI